MRPCHHLVNRYCFRKFLFAPKSGLHKPQFPPFFSPFQSMNIPPDKPSILKSYSSCQVSSVHTPSCPLPTKIIPPTDNNLCLLPTITYCIKYNKKTFLTKTQLELLSARRTAIRDHPWKIFLETTIKVMMWRYAILLSWQMSKGQ